MPPTPVQPAGRVRAWPGLVARALLALGLALLLGAPARADLLEETGPLGREAMTALQQDNLIKLREKAREILAQNSDSIPGNYFMGYSLHRSEGDLPRAHYHQEKARRLFEKRFGPTPGPGESPEWLQRILEEQFMVAAEMDRYQEEIDVLDAANRLAYHLYGGEPPLVVEYAWPLMKLGREREARERVELSLRTGGPFIRPVALNTLGAIEGEAGNARRSYEVFQQLVGEGEAFDGCTFLRNTGEGAWMVGDFAAAEQYFQRATEYFEPAGFSNPYWDLSTLYLAEARFPEAVEALRNMHRWTQAMEAFLAQQSYASNQMITAEVLLQLGYTRQALAAAGRAVQRPDRQGGNSVQRDQWEAGNLVLLRSALLARDQALQEQMSWTRGLRWWRLYLARQPLVSRAWSAGRRAVAVAVEHDRLAMSLRVYSAGTIIMADWHRPDLVELYGPGVTAAALEELKKNSKREDYQRQEPYLMVLKGEVEAQTGHPARAVATLDDALLRVPQAEALLRTRALARTAGLEYQMGHQEQAMQRFQRVLEQAPGMIRLLNMSLPVDIQGASTPALREAESRLLRSPRFVADDQGFRLELSDDGASLSARMLGLDGSVLAKVTVKAKDDPTDSACELVRQFHRHALAPRLDLSQSDLRGLDGSNLSGSVQNTRVQDMLGLPPDAATPRQRKDKPGDEPGQESEEEDEEEEF